MNQVSRYGSQSIRNGPACPECRCDERCLVTLCLRAVEAGSSGRRRVQWSAILPCRCRSMWQSPMQGRSRARSLPVPVSGWRRCTGRTMDRSRPFSGKGHLRGSYPAPGSEKSDSPQYAGLFIWESYSRERFIPDKRSCEWCSESYYAVDVPLVVAYDPCSPDISGCTPPRAKDGALE